MCGLAGFLGEGNEAVLRAMARAIAHRGPDGEGVWLDSSARIGLAHRRLAIIDPTSSAAQPMTSCGDRYQIVFNGEIYNFKDLAADLRRRGYRFNEKSDTAVIAPLYDAYGAACLGMLNGIFAFAIWDTVKKELLVARDASGVKPLYYVNSGAGLYFASELKALLVLQNWDRALDERALLRYLVNLWCPGEATPFRHVRKLLPGHLIRASADRFEIQKWHADDFRGGHQKSSKTAAADVLAALDRAVSDQCISDVPVGAFLSGGVDSSGVVASMVATQHRPARSYCIAFEGETMSDDGFDDDVVYARLMAKRLGIPLTEVVVKQPADVELYALPWTLDEPQADPAALYVSAISKQARADGIKVLLGGVAGDDVFSGYRRHRAAALRSRLPNIPAWVLDAASLAAGSSTLRRRLQKLGYLLSGSEEEFLLRAFEFHRRDDAVACLAGDVREALGTGEMDHLEMAAERSSGQPLLERMLFLEKQGFLPDHNLNYTDKASMLHGVEVRVPFLDTRLLRLAQDLSWRLKMKGFQEKWILKRALAERLPQNILYRKKTGFGAPVRSWLAGGPLRSMIEDVLASRSFRERGLFDVGAVDALLQDTTSGRRDGAYLIFALVIVEFWMQQFYDTDRSNAPPRGHDPVAPVIH